MWPCILFCFYITLHYITLHYITLHYITLHYITLHYITVQYITLHYITLHYITLRYVTLRYVVIYSVVYFPIIWLSKFVSSNWSISGPITHGADQDWPVTFALFWFCFVCMLAVFVKKKIVNHFFWQKKHWLASRLGCFRMGKRNKKAAIITITLRKKLTMEIVKKNLSLTCTYHIKKFCSVM